MKKLKLAATIQSLLLAAPVIAVAADDSNGNALFEMDEIVVVGTASSEMRKFDSSIAISTFSEDEINLKNPNSTADLISSVPGFWVESTSGTTQGNVFARGIPQDGGYVYVNLQEDGIPVYPVPTLSFFNADQFVRMDAMLDRVEAVRGGTGPIFAPGASGGIINFVTKSGTDTPEGLVKLTASDFGKYRGDFFWGGPIAESWKLGVGGYYRQSDGVRDPGYDADKGGQVRFKLTHEMDSGILEIFGKYLDDQSLFVVPIPLTDSNDPDGLPGEDAGEYSLHSKDINVRLPSAAEVGLDNADLEEGIHPELFTLGSKVVLDVAENVTLQNLMRFTDATVSFNGIFPGPAPVTGTQFASDNGVAPNFSVAANGQAFDPNELVQAHGFWTVEKDFNSFANDLRLNFEFDRNLLSLGFYYADYSMSDTWSLGHTLLMDAMDKPSRLILEGITDASGFTRYSFFNLIADHDARDFAFYISDEWDVTEQLRIDFGVRWQNQDVESLISDGEFGVDLDGDPDTLYDNDTALAGSSFHRIDDEADNLSYSIGFNYSLNDNHAFFGHFTDSARLPHFDDLRDGKDNKDEIKQIELGYKLSLENIALFATLFQSEFDNVFFNDRLADGSTVQRFASTETRGIELEGVYMPLESLDVQFSVTLQEPEYGSFTGSDSDGNPFDFNDNQVKRIPETMVRVTPTYRFNEGRGRAFFTYSYIDDRFANDANTIELPSYDTWDAGVAYDITERFSAQLNAFNLTDEVGITEGNPRTDIGAAGVQDIFMARPLFGRRFEASLSYRF